MDPVTQGLLGAGVAQIFLHKKIRRYAWMAGALGGIAPDIDIIIRSVNDPMLFYYYHRHFTHSLSFIPIGGLLTGLFFLLCMKAARPFAPWVMLAAFIGYATHGLLDACTSYGTVLLWPWSQIRISWDIISIIDPIFTGILLAGVLWCGFFDKVCAVKLALILAGCYLSFGIVQHHRALSTQQLLAKQRGHVLVKARATPAIGNLFSWRSLYVSNNNIYIDTIKTPLLSKPRIKTGIALVKFTQLPAAIATKASLARDYEIFHWFTDGYVHAIDSEPLTLIDARYLIAYKPVTALWGIEFPSDPKRRHIYWRRLISAQ